MLSQAELFNIEENLRSRFRRRNPETRFPWVNVYEWKGEVITSAHYQTDQEAFINADQSFYNDYHPLYWRNRRVANAGENEVRYLGCFDTVNNVLQIRTPKI